MKSEDEKFVSVNFTITKEQKKHLKDDVEWGSMSFNLRKMIDEYPKLKAENEKLIYRINGLEVENAHIVHDNERLKEELKKFNAPEYHIDCYDFNKHYKDEEE